MSSVQSGQLWVSAGHTVATHYVIDVKGENATVIEVAVEGTGRNAKVVRRGKDTFEVPVLTMLESWMPIGRPAPPPEGEKTWHRKLLEDPEF